MVLLGTYIINVWHPVPLTGRLVNCLTTLAVAVSIAYVGKSSRLVCLALFMAGAYLFHISGAGLYQWIEAMGRNTNLLMLLISVPMLGVPLRYGDYLATLDSLALKYMVRKYQMYWVPALFSHVLGVFMNLGAVPLAYQITARGRVAGYPGVLARSISRGFGSALFWSPNIIAVALVLGYTGVSWEKYVTTGIKFALVALVAGYAAEIFARKEKTPAVGDFSPEAVPAIERRKIFQLATAGAAFLALVIYIETRAGAQVISVIPGIALIFPAVWLLLLGRRASIGEGYGDYFKNRIGRYDGEVVLFSVAGFFSTALAQSGWAARICDYLMHFSGKSMASVALTILLAVILTSIVGIHPMVLVSAFATSLNAAAIGFNPVYLALVLIAGWSLGATVSPMSGTTLVVGSLTRKAPIEVAFDNLPYTVLVAAAIVIFLALS
jgi:TRAP-type C4-dicarboxylate transport system permease large subunit